MKRRTKIAIAIVVAVFAIVGLVLGLVLGLPTSSSGASPAGAPTPTLGPGGLAPITPAAPSTDVKFESVVVQDGQNPENFRTLLVNFSVAHIGSYDDETFMDVKMKSWPPGAPVGEVGSSLSDPYLTPRAGKYYGQISTQVNGTVGGYPGKYVYTVFLHRMVNGANYPGVSQDITLTVDPLATARPFLARH